MGSDFLRENNKVNNGEIKSELRERVRRFIKFVYALIYWLINLIDLYNIKPIVKTRISLLVYHIVIRFT